MLLKNNILINIIKNGTRVYLDFNLMFNLDFEVELKEVCLI